MRPVIITALAAVCLLFCVNPLWAMGGDKTYVFAVSACPPWKTGLFENDFKDIANACRNDVEIFTSSLKETLDIPAENVFTLLDSEATYQGLKAGLEDFAKEIPKGSRVFMLLNTHSDLADINQKDNPEKDEVLVLWTEEKPFTILSALTLKQWITASELRSMIDNVKADEIVITLDACHAGAALPDIINQHGRGEDWKGREAVMMSSTAEQFSYFTLDGTNGLFTKKLSESITSGSTTMEEAFNTAARETISYINSEVNQKRCSEMLFKTLHKKESCVQTPIKYDPSNLLPEIMLNSGS